MTISPNLIKLVLVVILGILMALIIFHPGADSVTDAVTHTFAIVIGATLHAVAKKDTENTE